jgi:cation:H+ antiporter
MDAFYREKPITSVVQSGHIITGAFGIMLLTLVVFAVLYPQVFGSLGWVGGYTFVFIAVYFLAIRVLFVYETRPKEGPAIAGHETSNLPDKKTIVIKYISFALLVIGAALLLPYFGNQIAVHYGLGQGFFGTLFLAAATSLPEVVVSVAAVRNNSADLAVGNVLGSNLFNIFILAVDDLIYTEGPLLSHVAPSLVIPALGAVVITAIGIAGLVFKSSRKWMLALDTFFILVVYVSMMLIMYRYAHSH